MRRFQFNFTQKSFMVGGTGGYITGLKIPILESVHGPDIWTLIEIQFEVTLKSSEVDMDMVWSELEKNEQVTPL